MYGLGMQMITKCVSHKIWCKNDVKTRKDLQLDPRRRNTTLATDAQRGDLYIPR